MSVENSIPDITVIVVTHNHEEYVDEALASISRQQTHRSVEVIIADDDSTDQTRAMAEKWLAESPLPGSLLAPSSRLGITLNYARAFAAARGRYVAVLEGDDVWTYAGKLDEQADALDRHPEASMVASRLELWFSDEGHFSVEPLIGLNGFETLLSSERIADSNWFATFSTAMYRRRALESIPPAIFETLAYDWAIAMAVTEWGPAVFLPRIATAYRIHNRGTWSRETVRARDTKIQQLIPSYIEAFDGRLSRELHRALVSVERRLLGSEASRSHDGSDTSEQAVIEQSRASTPRFPFPDDESRPPLVSVIVPSFNHGEFIERAIRSVLEQSEQDFEVIVVDDASSDDSVERVSGVSDPRLRLYRLPRNVGGAAALNFGVQQARGEYIAILNSDDMWMPSKLARQLEVIRARDVAAVFTGARYIGPDDRPLPAETLPAWGEIFRQPDRSRAQWLRYFFENGNALCHPSILIRRDAYETIGLYDNTLRQLPDFDRWIALVSHFDIAVLGDEPLVLFRLQYDNGNTSSVTPASVRRTHREHLWVAEQMLDRLPDQLLVEAFHDLLDEPTIGPGPEAIVDRAVLYLRATGPLASINREAGLRKVRNLMAEPETYLVLLTKYGIDDAFVHERAGLQELALTSDMETGLNAVDRPRVVDRALTDWSTGEIVRVLRRRLRNVPLRAWPGRVRHHLMPWSYRR
ncbi:glycosyltransferase involved in cell wall biosynthesis [Microcella putealis]|uniref:Glycosyltransferase involved in cell wall biosynthesis n=1 Tax=Microcella putealis TaxID=337005 RepID=A0A4Q7LTR5_9MICO|nr:glycosyltransferase [Microcella putealis]RZS57418.1 glycosyltransferase involved in cell wall biosynthesis [Microcella putealis]TQM19439.1 glycosyltransferase involved in cell wall biosynthesis [Microcella putealis]